MERNIFEVPIPLDSQSTPHVFTREAEEAHVLKTWREDVKTWSVKTWSLWKDILMLWIVFQRAKAIFSKHHYYQRHLMTDLLHRYKRMRNGCGRAGYDSPRHAMTGQSQLSIAHRKWIHQRITIDHNTEVNQSITTHGIILSIDESVC